MITAISPAQVRRFVCLESRRTWRTGIWYHARRPLCKGLMRLLITDRLSPTFLILRGALPRVRLITRRALRVTLRPSVNTWSVVFWRCHRSLTLSSLRRRCRRGCLTRIRVLRTANTVIILLTTIAVLRSVIRRKRRPVAVLSQAELIWP